MRTLWFGAANVDVSSPRWLSGGRPLMVGMTLPWNRLFIIGLATVAVAGMYVILFRTGAGLRIRAVTQNRSMAACLGVRAGTVDATTFALGAGLAGLACLVAGTALLSVPWALIVCGALLLSMSVYGAVRSDRTVTRNPR